MNSSPRARSVVWAIIRREYLTRVRRRIFIIATFLGPLMLVGGIAGLVVLTQNTEEPAKVWVADYDGILTYESPTDDGMSFRPYFGEQCFPERKLLIYKFGREAKSLDELKAEGFTSMIEFDSGVLQSKKGQLHYVSPPSSKSKRMMERDFSQAIERLKVSEQTRLTYGDYQALKTDITLVGIDMATGEERGEELGVLGFGFSMFMLVFVLVYGMHVMRGVIEEKSNRIVEVVLSTVRPRQLLTGKIVGIGLVGLTQILAWCGLSWCLFQVLGLVIEQSEWIDSWATSQGIASGTADFNTVISAQEGLSFLLDINWGVMLGCGLVYFVLGYLMYAAFFATIGAMVEQESDAQYLMLPGMLPLLFSYVLASMSIEAPESTLAVASSFLPFSSPISMMVRLPMGVPWWHVVVSLLILAISTFIVMAIAARVYRVAILMYGKRPSAREILRWTFRPDSGSL